MFSNFLHCMRRPAGQMTLLLLASTCFFAPGQAQSPLVVSSTTAAVPHNEIYGAAWQNTVDSRGDFVLLDFKSTGIYQYPANFGKEITVAAPTVVAGGFSDSGIAIDPRNNNMYIDDNYNNGLLMFAFDTKTGTWDTPPVQVATSLTGNLGGSCTNYFQSAGLSINHSGLMAVATENGCGVGIFTVPLDLQGNFGDAVPIVSNLKARARTLAVDDAGNVSWTEDNGVPGVLYVSAGTTGLNTEATVTRVDPQLGGVIGVSTDRAGNLYIADSAAGVYLVPMVKGAPTPAAAQLLTLAPGSSNPTLDAQRGVLFVPTPGFGTYMDLVKVYLNRAEFGTVATGTTAASPTAVTYTFSGAVTPSSFVIQEAGSAGDFALTAGGSCTDTIAAAQGAKKPLPVYAAASVCTANVNFAPKTVGDVSATLFMLDATGNILASTNLHGTGQASSVVGFAGTESALGSGLKAPAQVAVDAAGNVYVADGGLGMVLEYPRAAAAGATPVSVGTGLTAPTGVAVDGAGDIFIADSGKVIEVPRGPTGLNAAGQVTVASGFGAALQLAVDGIGNVFVSDPANNRVASLTALVAGRGERDYTGFTQLQAIASDLAGNLFVANGQSLVEISALGVQSTPVASLRNTTGLAVDASGSVYVTSTTQTVRIPNEAGTLNPADQVVLAAGAAKPVSIAIDSAGNAYVADAAALNIDFVNASAFINFGKLSSTTGNATGNVTLFNNGNAPLTITGFGSTPDYAVTSSTCVGTPIAASSSCYATVTFNPGPGDQGVLAASLLIQGNQGNAPVGINVTGTGATLAASKTTLTVTKPSVTSDIVAVTVASASGTGPVPTGNVTLTVTGTGFTPVVLTQALAAGTVTFNETQVPAGTQTFTANYIGDRVYGTSTATSTTAVSPGMVMLVQPPASAVPVYVLAGQTGSQPPYDNSQVPYEYNYPVTVVTANGKPLLGVPVYNAAGVQLSTNYGTVSYVTPAGTAACSANVVNVNADGTAPFSTYCFPIDTSNNQIPNVETTYTFMPVYSGNGNPSYATVTGTPVTVIALRNPSVIITSNPGAVTVASGSTVTANLTVTSLLGYGVTGINGNLNNYSLPVGMGCDGLPAHATCSFSYPTPDPSDPLSVDVTPTTPGQVVMTINTNVAVGTTQAALVTRTGSYLASVFGLGLFGLVFRRRRTLRNALFSLTAMLLLTAALGGLSACSSANISEPPILTTPKGTYMVTVTAKQVGSKQVPSSTSGAPPITVFGNGNQMSIPFSMSVTIQ